MINIKKISDTINTSSNLRVQLKKPVQSTAFEDSTNLNFIPHYPIIKSCNDILITAQNTLKNFYENFGTPKSATYVCEQIKQAKKQGLSDTVLDELNAKRRSYSSNTKKMRAYIKAQQSESFEEYIDTLKKYIDKNGSYMNCGECANLIFHDLSQKGIPAKNVLIYTVNSEGNRTPYVGHVFTLAGLDKNCDIKNPSSWGKNALICDGWAGICMPAEEGIEYYKKFFDIDPSKHKLMFSFESLPGEKNVS